MSEMGDFWRDYRAAQKERRKSQEAQNVNILSREGWLDDGKLINESPLCIRFQRGERPLADFWPSTGRYRLAKGGKTKAGGARAFIRWYNRQPAEQ